MTDTRLTDRSGLMDGSRPPVRSRAARWRLRLGAVGVSVAAALLVWLMASPMGTDLQVTSPVAGIIRIDAVLVVVTVIPLALAAWGVLALIERRSGRPRTVWTAVSVAVLAMSLPPLAFLDATIETKVALGLMHLATGLVLIFMLRRSLDGAPRRGGIAPSFPSAGEE